MAPDDTQRPTALQQGNNALRNGQYAEGRCRKTPLSAPTPSPVPTMSGQQALGSAFVKWGTITCALMIPEFT